MIALVPRHGTKNPIFGVLAHGLYDRLDRLKGKRHGVVSNVSGTDNKIFARVLQTSHING